MNKILFFLFIFLFSTQLPADIVVIANNQNKQRTLSKQQVQNIFMGRTRKFPDGAVAQALDQTKLRTVFYEQLLKQPIAIINAYWARLMFSGQKRPPLKLPDDNSVIKMVLENQEAIGYIQEEYADNENIQILFRFQKP